MHQVPAANNTPYIARIKARFLEGEDQEIWLEQLCAELVLAGVAKREGAYLLNT